MPIVLRHESDNSYRLDFHGLLRQPEFADCEAQLAVEIQRRGAVKLLCVLDRFEGWEKTRDWSNLTFYMKHGDAIERIAIVGNERWREFALMFASADLRQAPVEFFPESEMSRARAWLSASDATPADTAKG